MGRVGCHPRFAGCGVAAIALAILLGTLTQASASTVLGSWVPIFKGIEHAVGTNTPGSGGFPDLQVVHFLRVDLTDPDIRLYATPRITNYVANYTETAGYTMTNFLKNHGLQVAINANQFFLPNGSPPGYTIPEGTAINASQLLISEGQVVSAQTTADDPSVLMFATNNSPTFVPTNWPPRSTAGIYTAVGGPYSILVNGLNVGSNYINVGGSIHSLEPRTAFGLSQDRRYLFLLTIDGRQPGYSDGAYDWETAAWLLLAGAWDGANMDGGGSTCLVIMDSAGKPVVLNRDSASLASGRERTVGAHFGIYAKPVPGFFTNVLVQPDDTAATLTWTTTSPASTQVKYGLTTNLDLLSSSNTTLTSEHSVLLTNLTPDTGYYFALVGNTASTQNVSSNYFFTTTNYVITSTLFELTNSWRYTTENLDGTNWTSPSYDESAWLGPGPGVLWADLRGMNASIPVPLNTEMPLNSANGYPFPTYYFRTHFPFTNEITGVTMFFETYLDDGAVFYLNGTEIYRFLMPDAPTPIYNATLASGYWCSSGDATCPADFSLSGPLITTNLVKGDNVLAVEVHNYSAGSPDITFGLSATFTEPFTPSPELALGYSDRAITLSWNRGGFTLQESDSPTGTWTNVPGPVVTSPFTTTNSGAARFFRLQK